MVYNYAQCLFFLLMSFLKGSSFFSHWCLLMLGPPLIRYEVCILTLLFYFSSCTSFKARFTFNFAVHWSFDKSKGLFFNHCSFVISNTYSFIFSSFFYLFPFIYCLTPDYSSSSLSYPNCARGLALVSVTNSIL